jgi:hypothetical protein
VVSCSRFLTAVMAGIVVALKTLLTDSLPVASVVALTHRITPFAFHNSLLFVVYRDYAVYAFLIYGN